MAIRIHSAALILSVLAGLPAWAANEGRAVTISVPDPMVQNEAGTSSALELVREAYRRIGIALQTKVMPGERSIREADSGVTDGETIQFSGIEALYPNLMRVPEPVITLDLVAVSTGLDFPVKGWSSLSPYRLCVVRGMKAVESGAHGQRILLVNSLASAMASLQAGRCELTVFAAPTWQDVDRLNLGTFHELSPAVAAVSFYHYVNRRNADLIPGLAAALAAMRRDGTSAAITAADDQATAAARRHRTPID
jgi:polar amino acid transport system substrate-binding protein